MSNDLELLKYQKMGLALNKSNDLQIINNTSPMPVIDAFLLGVMLESVRKGRRKPRHLQYRQITLSMII